MNTNNNARKIYIISILKTKTEDRNSPITIMDQNREDEKYTLFCPSHKEILNLLALA